MNKISQNYLNNYLDSLPNDQKQKYTSFSSDYFCADKINADICANLIYQGVKTATCCLKYWYDTLDDMPQVGHLNVVTDWDGNPVCITETISLKDCKFSKVDERFALLEGEGDKSLKWWREAHIKFFSDECKQEGIEFHEEIELILEQFKVVYPAAI